jgi:hypothetical protein
VKELVPRRHAYASLKLSKLKRYVEGSLSALERVKGHFRTDAFTSARACG